MEQKQYKLFDRAYHDSKQSMRIFSEAVPDPDNPTKELKLQDQAVRYARTHEPPLAIFSEEVGAGGKRMYFVGSWRQLLKVMNEVKPRKRTFYEMVMCRNTMGCVMPVKLYADIEVEHAVNPDYDFSPFKETFERLVRQAIHELCPVADEAMQQAWFVWTNASNAEKLSYHAVLNIPGFAFDSGFGVGRLILYVLALAKLEGATCMTCNTVRNHQTLVRSPVDWTVYSSNRLYRMWGCTKRPKSDADPPRWILDEERRALLLQGKEEEALRFDPEKDAEWFFDGCCTHFYPEQLIRQQLLHVSLPRPGTGHDTVLALVKQFDGIDGILRGDELPEAMLATLDEGVARTGLHTTVHMKCGSTESGPVPESMARLVKQILPYTPIRTMTFDSLYGTVAVYTHELNCAILGGKHKTNHIWYQFCCGAAPERRGYRQRCTDPYDKKVVLPLTKFSPEQHALVDQYWIERLPKYVQVKAVADQHLQPKRPAEDAVEEGGPPKKSCTEWCKIKNVSIS